MLDNDSYVQTTAAISTPSNYSLFDTAPLSLMMITAHPSPAHSTVQYGAVSAPYSGSVHNIGMRLPYIRHLPTINPPTSDTLRPALSSNRSVAHLHLVSR